MILDNSYSSAILNLSPEFLHIETTVPIILE